MALVNSYELLDLNEHASFEEIRSAYFQKAKLYHPDRGGKTEDFLNIKRAHDILTNPSERSFLGSLKRFQRPLMRIEPSRHPNLDLLLRNLDAVKDRILAFEKEQKQAS
jgi:curved DNA-binding protein CbpA